jgi:hypothetical protein
MTLEEQLKAVLDDNDRLNSENDRLRAAAQAVVDRWETTNWEDAEATDGLIYLLIAIL